MKKLYIFVILLANIVYSQNFWTPSNGPYGGLITDGGRSDNGNIFISYNYLYSTAVFKSTNNGNNWIEIGLNNVSSLSCITIDKNNVLYAGGQYGVYRSTNEGLNWTNSLITSGVNDIDAIQNNIFAACNNGIYKSTNNGNNWILLGLSQATSIAKGLQNNIYASTWLNGIYKSSDNGNSWTPLNSQPPYSISSIAINKDGYIFAASGIGGLYRSTDSGSNWSEIEDPYIYKCRKVCVDSMTGVYVGTAYEGISCSTDNGFTWSNLTPYSSTVYGLFFIKDAGIFGGLESLYKSSNSGINWYRCDKGIMKNVVWDICKLNTGILIAGTITGLHKSTDEGLNWQSIGLDKYVIKSVTFNDNYIFAFGDGFYRSSDNGQNWVRIQDYGDDYFSRSLTVGNIVLAGITSGFKRSTNNGTNWQSYYNINTVRAFTKNNLNEIFAACSNGIFKSLDSGVTWSDKLSINQGNAIYCNNNNVIYAGSASGIYKSTNNGENWTSLGFSGHIIWTIREYGNYLITGSDIGFSYYNGIDWIELNSGLTNNSINDLELLNNGRLLAATPYSIFVSDGIINIEPISQNIPDRFELYQNYPNPFNPSTKLRFAVKSEKSNVKRQIQLVIYNALGQVVETLINEELNAGVYEVEFDGTNIASGVYYYSLVVGDASTSLPPAERTGSTRLIQTRKMVLLK
jgi:photosystem II stability/assembly factor-like uncharacterized protein